MMDGQTNKVSYSANDQWSQNKEKEIDMLMKQNALW